MKKLISTNKSNPISNLPEVSSIEELVEYTDRKIQKGLDEPTASTGTPMTNLSGGAKFMAQLSNIGGGSKATGGGGIRDGFNTIQYNLAAKAYLNGNASKGYIE